MLQKHIAKQPWMSTPCTLLSLPNDTWPSLRWHNYAYIIAERQVGLFDVVVEVEPVGWRNELSKI